MCYAGDHEGRQVTKEGQLAREAQVAGRMWKSRVCRFQLKERCKATYAYAGRALLLSGVGLQRHPSALVFAECASQDKRAGLSSGQDCCSEP